MRKSAIRKQLDAIAATKAALEADLEAEQSLDISAAQADLNSVTERVDDLTKQKKLTLEFLDERHNAMLESINFQQSALREHVEKILDVVITQEKDRAKALESRLRGMKGESNT